jgi:FkbM family methyltransferase
MSTLGLDLDSPFGTRRAIWWQRLVWWLCDHPRLPPSVRRRLRKRFARRVPGPFDITHEEVSLRLYPAENHCDRVLMSRQKWPELAEHRALDDLIGRDMVFVDIGANVGTYALYVGQKSGATARLIAFEPHPRTRQKLLFNLRANALPTRDVIDAACGGEDGHLDLWSDGGSNIGHTSLLKEGTSNAKVSERVRVTPLLRVVQDRGIPHIDLLKIDVEGFEDRALMPFFRSAPRSLWPKHLLIETVHHAIWRDNLTGFLEANGYRAVFGTVENQLYQLVHTNG